LDQKWFGKLRIELFLAILASTGHVHWYVRIIIAFLYVRREKELE
jgi:hypothetical protein